METQPKNIAQNGQQFTDLKAVVSGYFYHWPLFLLGLVTAAVFATVYLHLARPAYEVSATILVKDEKKSPQEKSGLDELELSNTPKNAETEIQILRSNKLIAQVVEDLGLHTEYVIGGLKRRVVYRGAPFQLITKNVHTNKDVKLKITIVNNNYANVSGPGFENKKVAFNQDMEDDFASWKLVSTPHLQQFIGNKIEVTIADPEKVVKAYTKRLDARLLDKLAPTIGLFLTDEVPQRGKDFLNSLIAAYNTEAAQEERKLTKSTIDFIDKRLSSLTGELNDAENKVEGYKSSEGITDLNSQSKVYLENVQANDTKLNEVNVKLSNIEQIENYVNSSANQNVAPPAQGIVSEVLNGLVMNLTQLQLKRVALLTTTPEGNPLFEPINMQIKTTKAAIRENIVGTKAFLRAEKRELQLVNSKVQSSIKGVPNQERQYVGMKRQESIKENLYVYLLQKREEMALSYASTRAEARVVDHAIIGDIKWPRPSLVWVIALMVGIGVPFMVIYFRSAFTRKITQKREIEEELDIPVIAEISYEKLDSEIVMMDKYPQLISEQFRALRTKVYHLNRANVKNEIPADAVQGKITLCTSSTVNEGKSFVAVNLAASMAAAGKRTLLLEMDLRRPRIASIFNLNEGLLGTSEFLDSAAELTQIVHSSGIQENLHIVPSGKIRNHPSELLEGQKVDHLFQLLRSQFDEIVIDSPPLHLVADAMIVGRYADLCLYIVRQGHTSKQELAFISKMSAEISNMNIVFNGIISGKYGYGYQYDQGYYLKRSKRHDLRNSWKTLVSKL